MFDVEFNIKLKDILELPKFLLNKLIDKIRRLLWK
jgi:hypothetical protein